MDRAGIRSLARAAESHSITEWLGVSPEERGAALRDLLDLADAIPPNAGTNPKPPLAEKVVAIHEALRDAGLPHAIGGAIALAYYGEPRVTVDVDVNAFLAVDSWPEVRRALSPLGIDVEIDELDLGREKEVRLRWGRNDIHLFFATDALHEAMPHAVRDVPFGGVTIPIVSPEHLIARKAVLDRPKDWLDIEAILIATEPLDLDEALTWVRRLTAPDDPRVTKLCGLAGRACT